MFSRLWGYLAAAGALVAAILGALFAARRSGEKEEQAAQTERALKQSEQSNAIDKEVRARADADLDERLRKYQRD